MRKWGLMSRGCALIPGVLLALMTFNGEATAQGPRHSAGGSSPAVGPAEGVDGVAARLTLLRATSAGWEFELSVRNGGKRAVYLMTDPVQAEGVKGPYLSVDPSDHSVLDLGVRVYHRPEYTLYVNHSGVTLERLEPGASRVQTFTVPPPVEETMPPYPKGTIIQRRIVPASIRYVTAHVGVLPDDEGVRDYLRSKEGIGPYADGAERLEAGSFKGKQLIDLQTLISSEKVELKP